MRACDEDDSAIMISIMTAATSRSEKTKYRLAQALKECLKTTPLEEVTIKQLVSSCGLTRQTFYRNFADLNDLVQWYFNIILDESFRQLGSTETVYDGLVRKFEYIHEEHLYFSAAFRSDRENNLRDHDFHMILDFYRTDALLEMYCQASVYMTVKWVLSGMPQSEKTLASLMIEAMPEKLRTLFVRLQLI